MERLTAGPTDQRVLPARAVSGCLTDRARTTEAWCGELADPRVPPVRACVRWIGRRGPRSAFRLLGRNEEFWPRRCSFCFPFQIFIFLSFPIQISSKFKCFVTNFILRLCYVMNSINLEKYLYILFFILNLYISSLFQTSIISFIFQIFPWESSIFLFIWFIMWSHDAHNNENQHDTYFSGFLCY
jgi:hypothetical protein